MKCKECNSLLLSLYFRERIGEKHTWIKIRPKYCKKCKKVNK